MRSANVVVLPVSRAGAALPAADSSLRGVQARLLRSEKALDSPDGNPDLANLGSLGNWCSIQVLRAGVMLAALSLVGCDGGFGSIHGDGAAWEPAVPDSVPGRSILSGETDAVTALKRAGARVARVLRPLSAASARGTVAVPAEAQDVDLGGVPLDERILDELNSVAGLTQLTLTGPFVDDAVMASLTCGEWLTTLNLAGSNITDEGLKYLTAEAFPALTILTLNETRVTGEGLSGLPQVKILHLANTEIGDADLLRLAHQEGLMLLTLTGTNVTEKGIAEFKRTAGSQTVLVWSAASASTSLETQRGTGGRPGRLGVESMRPDAGLTLGRRPWLMNFEFSWRKAQDVQRRQRCSSVSTLIGAGEVDAARPSDSVDRFAEMWICLMA